ncbi:MAG: hypothetical protein ACRCX2_21625 [Paraclostridium sp.]
MNELKTNPIFNTDFRELVLRIFNDRVVVETSQLEKTITTNEEMVLSLTTELPVSDENSSVSVSTLFPDKNIASDAPYGEFLESLNGDITRIKSDIETLNKNLDAIANICDPNGKYVNEFISIEDAINDIFTIDVNRLSKDIDNAKKDVQSKLGGKNVKPKINDKIRYIRKVRKEAEKGLYRVNGGYDLNSANTEYENLLRMSRSPGVPHDARRLYEDEALKMKSILDSVSTLSVEITRSKTETAMNALTNMLIKYLSYSIRMREIVTIEGVSINGMRTVKDYYNAIVIAESYRFISKMVAPRHGYVGDIVYKLVSFILADKELVSLWCKNILGIDMTHASKFNSDVIADDLIPETQA